MSIFHATFALFLTWWGAFALAALDATVVFFLPFGVDAVVIYLAARHRDLFWLAPLVATAGSVVGAALTFWIGKKVGEAGLDRLISPRRLERVRARVRDTGAIAMALPALAPPPFPLSPFILTSGALNVNPYRFFATFAGFRLLRFGVEAFLARRYGRGILNILQSDTFENVVLVFVAIAVIGTVASAAMLWRNSRTRVAA